MKIIVNLILASAAVVIAQCAFCDNAEPMTCQHHNMPTCGTFRKNFGNACELEAAKCELAKQGFHFMEEINGNCCENFAMPLLYNPKCGIDGKVHGNQWAMALAGCSIKDYITEVDPSQCPDFPQDMLIPAAEWEK